MPKYTSVEITERQLEDLIRRDADLIEEGLKYIDHQHITDRGPLDVLMVDSGRSLVVAELKVIEDDSMLVQGIDYYDYIVRNTEAMVRVYKAFEIDPEQPVRLFLIAPSFSVSLLNRCKWIDMSISLFTFKCIRLQGSDDVVPVFAETTIPSVPRVVKPSNTEDRIRYITDDQARERARALLVEIQSWDQTRIAIEPTKYDISLKVSGRVFAYLCPRRKFTMIYTYDSEGKWTGYPVHQDEDLEAIKALVRTSVDRLRQA